MAPGEELGGAALVGGSSPAPERFAAGGGEPRDHLILEANCRTLAARLLAAFEAGRTLRDGEGRHLHASLENMLSAHLDFENRNGKGSMGATQCETTVCKAGRMRLTPSSGALGGDPEAIPFEKLWPGLTATLVHASRPSCKHRCANGKGYVGLAVGGATELLQLWNENVARLQWRGRRRDLHTLPDYVQ